MTKSEFIQKVLKDKDNTVFVNKEQVSAVIDLFQKCGMLPPKRRKMNTIRKVPHPITGYCNEWEQE